MKTKKLISLSKKELSYHKAKHITTLDVKDTGHFIDAVIIATGTSKRHVKHLAKALVRQAKANQHTPIYVEDDEESQWVLVDLGDIVVHIMQQETRDFYQLEALWQPNSDNVND